MGTVGQTFLFEGLRATTFKRVGDAYQAGILTTSVESSDAKVWTESPSQPCYLEDMKRTLVYPGGGMSVEYDTIDVDGTNLSGFNSTNPITFSNGYIMYYTSNHNFGADDYAPAMVLDYNDNPQYIRLFDYGITCVKLAVQLSPDGAHIAKARFYCKATYTPVGVTENAVNWVSAQLGSSWISAIESESDQTGGENTPIGGQSSSSGYHTNKLRPILPTTNGNFVITKCKFASDQIKPVITDPEDRICDNVYGVRLDEEVDEFTPYGSKGRYADGHYNPSQSNATFYNDYMFDDEVSENNDYFYNLGSAFDYRENGTGKYTNAINLALADHLAFNNLTIEIDSKTRIMGNGFQFIQALSKQLFQKYSEEDQDWQTIDECSMQSMGANVTNYTAPIAYYLCMTTDKKFFVMKNAPVTLSDYDGAWQNLIYAYQTHYVLNEDWNYILNAFIVEESIEDANNTNNNISGGGYEEDADPGERGGPGQDETPKGRRDEVPDGPETTLGTGGINCGFFRVYNPSEGELQALASEMNSNDVWAELKEFFTNDPMDGIVSLHLLPYVFQAGDKELNPETVYIGNYPCTQTLTAIIKRYVTFDFGYNFVPVCYEGHEFLNYSPYTKISIHLPYIGVQEVSPDDIVGRNTHLIYNIDVITGAVCAVLKVIYDGEERTRYTWSGQAIAQLPLSGRNHNQLISSLMTSATDLVSGVITKNPTKVVGAVAGGAVGLGKVEVKHGGSFSGQSGWLGSKQAFYIISNPEFEYPYNRPLLEGYPLNATFSINEITGDQEFNNSLVLFREIDLQGLTATADEMQMIKDILTNEGVWLS